MKNTGNFFNQQQRHMEDVVRLIVRTNTDVDFKALNDQIKSVAFSISNEQKYQLKVAAHRLDKTLDKLVVHPAVSDVYGSVADGQASIEVQTTNDIDFRKIDKRIKSVAWDIPLAVEQEYVITLPKSAYDAILNQLKQHPDVLNIKLIIDAMVPLYVYATEVLDMRAINPKIKSMSWDIPASSAQAVRMVMMVPQSTVEGTIDRLSQHPHVILVNGIEDEELVCHYNFVEDVTDEMTDMLDDVSAYLEEPDESYDNSSSLRF